MEQENADRKNTRVKVQFWMPAELHARCEAFATETFAKQSEALRALIVLGLEGRDKIRRKKRGAGGRVE